MKNSFSYYMPTKIYYGIDSVNFLSKLVKNRKTLLVTTEGAVKRGLLERLCSVKSHIFQVITNVYSHPDLEDLKLLYREINHENIELILAVGGGSVIDSAKFFSVYKNNNDPNFIEDLIKGKNDPNQKINSIPIISVPTTSGTSSEITPWATIWDRKLKKKFSLHLECLFSESAIYDPTLTLSIPYEITVQSALDSLSHALESIWNRNANPITLNFAVKSIQLFMEYLPPLSKNLKNLQLRDKLMEASMYAGLAFSNTQTAIAHAVSYYITMQKGIPHGLACSFTIPFFIDKVIGKYHFVDIALKEAFGTLSSSPLRDMFETLGVSTNFSDYGINDFDIELIKKSLLNNPRACNSLVEF